MGRLAVVSLNFCNDEGGSADLRCLNSKCHKLVVGTSKGQKHFHYLKKGGKEERDSKRQEWAFGINCPELKL